MDISSKRFQTKILQPTSAELDYQLYKAALEWDLIEPIVIEDSSDLKSEQNWRNRVEPFNHQVTNLISFCRRLPVTLLADDVGLGKTISAGLVISELMARHRIAKILIVCPKILGEQWKEELETKFAINSIVVTGRELIAAELPDETGAVITTYHSARLYLDKIADAGYDMLILDEAHKLRNLYGTDKTPQVAKAFQKALKDRLFRYVLLLTATPIQNRLWDIYSLVDLLTVARGHENPFGSPGIFSRKFIADNRTSARQLKPESQQEFRDIVYDYMSRIRRGDTDLQFPERVVELRAVEPTSEEKQLIDTVAKSIELMPILVQIGILQVLVSSPEALVSWLDGMARRGTAPQELATEVKEIASRIKQTSKFTGLKSLIEKLRAENPEKWRLVIFTRWRETQTSIQIFLEQEGISYGLINGDSGDKNQETIRKFKEEVPEAHVVISTEAGSEGVNLQIANVLLNWDLPWNPMIVEQRIGRIQRLNSSFAKVVIVNIILKGTFEEYIVGRLMEKLQMASNAIGDIEALLSGMSDNDEEEINFEEKIRELVVLSLKGNDVQDAKKRFEDSIIAAKKRLKEENENINTLLGETNDYNQNQPAPPHFPPAEKSMDLEEFVIHVLEKGGGKLQNQGGGIYLLARDEEKRLLAIGEHIKLDKNSQEFQVTPYKPGSPAFSRLVASVSNKALYLLNDIDSGSQKSLDNFAAEWAATFNGSVLKINEDAKHLYFKGKVLLKIKATVAHDSYERLIEVDWIPNESLEAKINSVAKISGYIDNPKVIGLSEFDLTNKAQEDEGVAEFCRFYLERLQQELSAVGENERKRKKIEDDFTPRLEILLCGINGEVYHKVAMTVDYKLEVGNDDYSSSIVFVPSRNEFLETPLLEVCQKTKSKVPENCLGKCSISGQRVLKEFLVKSDVSDRYALKDYMVTCAFSGKRALTDEVEKSDVTGDYILRDIIRVSDISGKKGEPNLFASCEFTSVSALKEELAVSEVSERRYRVDEKAESCVSRKSGHKSEFIRCPVTGNLLLESEAEKCQITKQLVMPGVLEECVVSHKKVLPTELIKSAVSGKKALKTFFVSSSISDVQMLEEEAIKSIAGKYCLPAEAKKCFWSSRIAHPNDLKEDVLTGETFHIDYLVEEGVQFKLKPLRDLLDGIVRKVDSQELWLLIEDSINKATNKKCAINASQFSEDKKILAVCAEQKALLGLRKKYIGLLYSVSENSVFGRITVGKRANNKWVKV